MQDTCCMARGFYCCGITAAGIAHIRFLCQTLDLTPWNQLFRRPAHRAAAWDLCEAHDDLVLAAAANAVLKLFWSFMRHATLEWGPKS